jgi:hypothetical protein
MWAVHLCRLLAHSFADIPNRIGTNWFGLFFESIILALVILIFKTVYKWRRQQMTLRDAVAQVVIECKTSAIFSISKVVVAGVFLWVSSVIANVYEDHQNLVAAAGRFQDDNRAIIASNEQKTTVLQKRIDELSLPELRGTITASGLAPAQEHNKSTLLFVWAEIENTGAPSIAKNYRAGISFNGSTVWGTPIGGGVSFNAGTRDAMRFDSRLSLSLRSTYQPIPRGGLADGFLYVLLENIRREDVMAAGTSAYVVITFQDINNRNYEVRKPVGKPQHFLDPRTLQPPLRRRP